MFNRKNQIQDIDAYVEERLSEYLDGTLSDKERQIVQAHLATSERARASYESLRYTVNLLKQTPAPSLPRQFTLPVTSRAPARTAPGWLVWGLRGVAVAATAAFVLLLTTTLLRQNNANQTFEQAPAAAVAQATPSVMVAMGPTALPTVSTQTQDNADHAGAPPASPIMITIEPPANTPTAVPTLAPAAATNKALPTQLPPSPAQDTLPAPAAQEEPTSIFSAELAEPTPTDIREMTDATAAGSAPAANTPESAPSTSVATTQRSMSTVAIDGVITATRLRVRRGPGIEYPAIGNLSNGDRVKIVGRDLGSDWLVIEYPQDTDTGVGWIGALFVDESIPVNILPIYDAPELVPPEKEPTAQVPLPTVTPTDMPTAEPTEADIATDVPTDESDIDSIIPILPEEPTATPRP